MNQQVEELEKEAIAIWEELRIGPYPSDCRAQLNRENGFRLTMLDSSLAGAASSIISSFGSSPKTKSIVLIRNSMAEIADACISLNGDCQLRFLQWRNLCNALLERYPDHDSFEADDVSGYTKDA